MPLKRKGTRLIRVGGESYRWTISRSIQAETGTISVIIEAVENPGRRLAVRVLCRDFWLDFSDFRDAPPAGFMGAYRPVTPALVEKIIRAAVMAGWSPGKADKNLRLEWTADGVLIPLAKSEPIQPASSRKRRQ